MSMFYLIVRHTERNKKKLRVCPSETNMHYSFLQARYAKKNVYRYVFVVLLKACVKENFNYSSTWGVLDFWSSSSTALHFNYSGREF